MLPQDLSKSPKTMKKLLPKRKPERKPSDEEFALRKSKYTCEDAGLSVRRREGAGLSRAARGSQGPAEGPL